MSNSERIILFGGSFDPMHKGHLGVALHALRELQAEKLFFVPAGQSPHKKQPHTAQVHRLEMIQCAIEPFEGMLVSDCELHRAGPSYTLDTVRHFRERFGADIDLYWLIGADQLADLAKWYHIDELLSECHICTMVRAGYAVPDMSRFKGVFGPEIVERLRRDTLYTPLIPINSTDIRNRIRQGSMPYDDLPECVAKYIEKHQLYRFS